ncbi:MAG: hypothetical protein KDD37_11655 [Bdellovibrionales bacterium]|nr:hypothetical protein [Bdellovibrionales bacterium]
MSESVTRINVDTIEPSHRTGLLFSLYEGLKGGESFTVISENSLELLKKELSSAEIKNLKLELSELPLGINAIKVKKTVDKDTGCCGMCGG